MDVKLLYLFWIHFILSFYIFCIRFVSVICSINNFPGKVPELENKQPRWGAGWVKHNKLILIRVVVPATTKTMYDWSITMGLPGLLYNEETGALGACTSMLLSKCIQNEYKRNIKHRQNL